MVSFGSLVGWPKGRLIQRKFRVNRHGVAKSVRKPGNFPPKIVYQMKQTDIIPLDLDSQTKNGFKLQWLTYEHWFEQRCKVSVRLWKSSLWWHHKIWSTSSLVCLLHGNIIYSLLLWFITLGSCKDGFFTMTWHFGKNHK